MGSPLYQEGTDGEAQEVEVGGHHGGAVEARLTPCRPGKGKEQGAYGCQRGGAAFHKQRVLPLTLWPLFMYQMMPLVSLEGTKSTEAIFVAEVTRHMAYTMAPVLADNFMMCHMHP